MPTSSCHFHLQLWSHFHRRTQAVVHPEVTLSLPRPIGRPVPLAEDGQRARASFGHRVCCGQAMWQQQRWTSPGQCCKYCIQPERAYRVAGRGNQVLCVCNVLMQHPVARLAGTSGVIDIVLDFVKCSQASMLRCWLNCRYVGRTQFALLSSQFLAREYEVGCKHRTGGGKISWTND